MWVTREEAAKLTGLSNIEIGRLILDRTLILSKRDGKNVIELSTLKGINGYIPPPPEPVIAFVSEPEPELWYPSASDILEIIKLDDRGRAQAIFKLLTKHPHLRTYFKENPLPPVRKAPPPQTAKKQPEQKTSPPPPPPSSAPRSEPPTQPNTFYNSTTFAGTPFLDDIILRDVPKRPVSPPPPPRPAPPPPNGSSFRPRPGTSPDTRPPQAEVEDPSPSHEADAPPPRAKTDNVAFHEPADRLQSTPLNDILGQKIRELAGRIKDARLQDRLMEMGRDLIVWVKSLHLDRVIKDAGRNMIKWAKVTMAERARQQAAQRAEEQRIAQLWQRVEVRFPPSRFPRIPVQMIHDYGDAPNMQEWLGHWTNILKEWPDEPSDDVVRQQREEVYWRREVEKNVTRAADGSRVFLPKQRILDPP